jgi:histidine triad (HIT) family protein
MREEYEYSDWHAVAFEPLNPVTAGHLLVVPRVHVRDAGEDPEVTGHVASLAAAIAGPASEGAYNLITSAGPAATQSVFHLHFHIVPRWVNDGLMLPWSPRSASVTNVVGDSVRGPVIQGRDMTGLSFVADRGDS